MGNGMHNTTKAARIQLVDDDPIVTTALQEGLHNAGYEVVVGHDAAGALSDYQALPPDLAIVDIGLPDMPGTELAAAMLQHCYRPILVLSSHSDKPRVQQAISNGVVGYLVKPLSAQQLIPSIETALARFVDISEELAARLEGSAQQNVTLNAVLDQFAFAVAIVDAQARVLYENTSGRRLLDDHPLLHRANGSLCAHRKQQFLSKLLAEVVAGKPGAEALTLNNGDLSLNLFMSSLENADAAIVLMIDPQQASIAPARILRTLYGLTAKESQLAEGLLNGNTLEEYCALHHVTLNTVRSQLKAIYRKTDTNRQAELIRLLSRLFDNVNTQRLG